jgi:hypothetical protein
MREGLVLLVLSRGIFELDMAAHNFFACGECDFNRKGAENAKILLSFTSINLAQLTGRRPKNSPA